MASMSLPGPFSSLDGQQISNNWSDSEEEESNNDNENQGNGNGNSGNKNGTHTRTTTPILNRQQTTWITQQMRLIERDYRIDKDQVLGEPGRFGTAFLCWRHPTSFESTKSDWCPEYRCVKYINKASLSLLADQKEKERIFKTLAREIGVLKCVDHPNIVQLFDVYENRHEIHLIMEYLPGGELFDRISCKEDGYSEKDAAHIIHQILDALNYLHDRGIMHLDLKPENILFTSKDKERIKLIDFGLSRVVPRFSKLRAKNVGTTPYNAPEIFEGNYNLSADIWSVGVILFCMVFGYPPFYYNDETNAENKANYKNIHLDDSYFNNIIENKIRKEGFTPQVKPGFGPWFPQSIPISKNLQQLISKMLTTDVKQRWTVKECLDSPWLRGHLSDNSMPTIVRDGLLKFNSHCKFKAAISAMFRDVISQAHFDEIEKVFNSLDTNKDGKISCDEFINGMKNIYKSNLDRQKLESIFENADLDGNQYLTIDELIVIAAHHSLINEDERLYNVFNELDYDSDGVITKEELLRVAKKKSSRRQIRRSVQSRQSSLESETTRNAMSNNKNNNNNNSNTNGDDNKTTSNDQTNETSGQNKNSNNNNNEEDNKNDNNGSYLKEMALTAKHTIRSSMASDNWADRIEDILEERANEFLSNDFTTSTTLTYEQFLRMIHPDFEPSMTLAEWAKRRENVPSRVRASAFDVDLNLPSANPLGWQGFTNDFQSQTPRLGGGKSGGLTQDDITLQIESQQTLKIPIDFSQQSWIAPPNGMMNPQLNTLDTDDLYDDTQIGNSASVESSIAVPSIPPSPAQDDGLLKITPEEMEEYKKLKEMKMEWEKEKMEYEKTIENMKVTAEKQQQDFSNRLINSIDQNTNVLKEVKLGMEQEFQVKERALQTVIDEKNGSIANKDKMICDFQEQLNEHAKTIDSLKNELRENECSLQQAIDSKIESLRQIDLMFKKMKTNYK